MNLPDYLYIPFSHAITPGYSEIERKVMQSDIAFCSGVHCIAGLQWKDFSNPPSVTFIYARTCVSTAKRVCFQNGIKVIESKEIACALFSDYMCGEQICGTLFDPVIKAYASLDGYFPAKKGAAAAQIYLGDCYYNGNGVEQDYKKAVEWHSKAAEQGNANAQYNMGLCYYNGHGVQQDYGKSVEWYSKAAEQGDADAQSNLGYCYYCGDGVEQDYKKAVEWYSKASEQGDADAQFYLGKLTAEGNGIEQNTEAGMRLIKEAAKNGCEDAKQFLEHSDKSLSEELCK